MGKTIAREEASQNEILELHYKLKRSEYRGEQAEMNIQRLNVRIDQVEEDLLSKKAKKEKSGKFTFSKRGCLNVAVGQIWQMYQMEDLERYLHLEINLSTLYDFDV